MATISSPGIGSGLDINSLVSQLVAAEAAGPTSRLDRQETRLQVRLSGYGSLKGALSALQSATNTLSDFRSYSARSVSSSDTDVLVASASGEPAIASYDVSVANLAESHKLSTDPALANAQFTSLTDTIGTGTLTFRFGTTVYDSGTDTYTSFTQSADKSSATVKITDGTLQGIRDAINQADIGVTASIINDGSYYRLAITSNDTGADNSLEISVDDDDLNDTDGAGLSLLAFNSASTNLTQTAAAVDASLTVNGISITSASNTLNDAIENMTLTLKQAGSSTVKVASDTSNVKTAVQGLVNTYNSFLDTVDTLTGYDPDTQQAGTLNGDGLIRTITSGLQRLIGTPVGGPNDAVRILADIGITTDSTTGKLIIDEGQLDDKIANNIEDIKALFAVYGRTTDGFVAFDSASADTRVGEYAVNITQLATRGSFTGSAAANLTITAGVNDTLVTEIDGISATITLTAGTYTADTLAAELQGKLNEHADLKNNGVTVEVTQSSGVLTVTSNRYGSASVVNITGGTARADLFGSSPTSADGVDVAGTIGGLAATGNGQYLTGASGDVEGLKLLITGTQTGNRGTVDFRRGYASQLNDYLEQIIGSEGSLGRATETIQDGISRINDDRERLQLRLDSIEQRIRNQFIALDTLLSQLQNTSVFLGQQLAALPQINVSQKSG